MMEYKTMANKDQKRQKDNPQDKTQSQSKSTKPSFGKDPKPFQQFLNQNKFSGGQQKSSNNFHRRISK